MELVTEPVMHSSEEAMKFGKELQLLLQYLGVSDANMEKGEMRVEVNLSVSKTDTFGTKVEVKNINSFRAVGKAIDFEFERQTKLLENGEKIVQETRGWDENKEITFSQRLKESAHDYRYFEDPDLPKIIISEIPDFSTEELKKLLVELPWEKRERLSKDFNLKPEDIEIYVGDRQIGKFFEDVVIQLQPLGSSTSKLASNYIISDIVGLSKSEAKGVTFGKITEENFVKLISMISRGDLSSRGAKDILKIMFGKGGDPEVIAKEKNLIQKNDEGEIKKLAEKIIGENPEVVIEYKNGKEQLLQFLVGQGMKETKGSANPELFKKSLLEILK